MEAVQIPWFSKRMGRDQFDSRRCDVCVNMRTGLVFYWHQRSRDEIGLLCKMRIVMRGKQ